MSGHHSYMQKEDKRGNPTGPVIRIATADWARYRASGYIFCEKTEEFDPHAEYMRQTVASTQDRSERAAERGQSKAEQRAALKGAQAEGDLDALRDAAEASVKAAELADEAHEESKAALKADKKNADLKLAVTAAEEISNAADEKANGAMEAVEAAEAALISGD